MSLHLQSLLRLSCCVLQIFFSLWNEVGLLTILHALSADNMSLTSVRKIGYNSMTCLVKYNWLRGLGRGFDCLSWFRDCIIGCHGSITEKSLFRTMWLPSFPWFGINLLPSMFFLSFPFAFIRASTDVQSSVSCPILSTSHSAKISVDFA